MKTETIKNPKRVAAARKAWETIRENKFEDELSERADKAVRTKKLSARALKAWATRRNNS